MVLLNHLLLGILFAFAFSSIIIFVTHAQRWHPVLLFQRKQGQKKKVTWTGLKLIFYLGALSF